MTKIIGRNLTVENMPIPPIARLIGFNIVEIDKGCAVMEFVSRNEAFEPYGYSSRRSYL